MSPFIASFCTNVLAASALALAPLQTPVAPPRSAPPIAAEKPVPLDVSELLAPIRARNDVPALVGAIVTLDGLEAIGVDGVRRRGGSERATIGDQFHLGSCTKSMTATLVAMLVEEHALAFDTPVGGAFAKSVDPIDPGWKRVTIEELLTHRGGAPGGLQTDGLWGELWKREGTPREQRMTLVRGVLRRAPESAPGTKFTYSNAGFAIAGAMAESAADKPWESLMRERLFTPLGMSSAGFGAPGTPGKLDQPLGHNDDGSPVELGPGDDNPPAIGPAGTVHCSIGDWSKYVALHLRGEREGSKLLSKESFVRLHTPPSGAQPPYAFGWMIAERPWAGGRVLTHNGSNNMWFCVTWLAPEKGFAVLACTNQGGSHADHACDEAAAALIEHHAAHAAPAAPPSGK